MPKSYTYTRQNGEIIPATAKWSSEEVDRMPPGQLVEVLSEIREFANYCEETFFTPIDALEEECKTLEEHRAAGKKMLMFFGIAAPVCVILTLLLNITNHAFLGFLTGIATFFAIGLLIFTVVWAVNANGKYNKRYETAKATLERLKQEKEDVIFGTRLVDLVSGYAILPNYYLTVSALDFMIHALRNHRASTLGQAVNLYELEKAHLQQIRILHEQRDAMERAARAAERAASDSYNS